MLSFKSNEVSIDAPQSAHLLALAAEIALCFSGTEMRLEAQSGGNHRR